MAKRVISAILIVLLLLPVVITAGSLLFAPKSILNEFDKYYETSIREALSSSINESNSSASLPEENRYVVKFKSEADDSRILKALENSQFSLLSESKHKLFSVVPEEGFFDNNDSLIEYYEPDLVRSSLATTNDPATISGYEPIGIYNAWDTVTANQNVKIAVLDTGVDRTHEDLEGVNILSGYDAVAKRAGVNGDSVGHGTGVIGLIAATANNGIGIAGVAHGATILPIKVSSSGSTIYSSDLIAGIRFAADAGAKIINMSVGGYTSSLAEQEAVNYAISKGCILIAAAGNDGNRTYGDQKSYPASYEGVISVGSCNEDGERSSFSQRNDGVDVVAPGENIPLTVVENGESVYRYDSGTSFSCALVSGIAALAVTYNDNSARLNNAEFEALIIDTLRNYKKDFIGYGMINSEAVIKKTLEPIVVGITSGTTYTNPVTIGFNRGTATLDGDAFFDGDTVIANGVHILEITNGDSKRIFAFRLNYASLSFEFKEFSSYACFEFQRGAAFLDGIPYKSGAKITASGKHEFLLSDGDEKLTETIYLQYGLPKVYGVSDGEVYDKPVNIVILGDGEATLDGFEIIGHRTVSENGTHVLKLKSGNGASTQTITFEINFEGATITDFDLAKPIAAIDEENGYMALYSESLVGFRIYNLESPEEYLHFVPAGEIYSHAFVENNLIFFGENGITVIDRALALNGEEAVLDNVNPEEFEHFCFANGEIFGFGNQSIYRFDLETETGEEIFNLGFDCYKTVVFENEILLLSEENPTFLYIFDLTDESLRSFNLGFSLLGTPICFADGYFSVGTNLYDSQNGNLVLELYDSAITFIENDRAFNDQYIFEISSGRILGSFSFGVSSVVKTEDYNYLFGYGGRFAKVKNDITGVASYCAAELTEKIISDFETVTPYRKNAFYDKYRHPISLAASDNYTYLLFDQYNMVCKYDMTADKETDFVPLKFIPQQIVSGEKHIAVSFKNANVIYLANENDVSNGTYININAKCNDLFIANGRIYAVLGGRLSSKPLEGGNFTANAIDCTEIGFNGENIFALNRNTLSVYSTNLAPIQRIAVRGEGLFVGNGFVVGKTLYYGNGFGESFTFDNDVIAMSGNTVVTSDGVFSVSENRYIGNIGVIPTVATFNESNDLIACGMGIISVCSSGDENEITSAPQIDGIEEGSIYLGSVTINYQNGIGYLDGNPFETGSTVETAGEHFFSVSLPCGNIVFVRFFVEARIESIRFLSPTRTMSVGETVTLRIRYNPEGASSVPATFVCEDEGLTVDENGEVTANEVGEFTVVATVSTDYGSFSAECVITVRDDLITFPQDSGISVDRDREFVLGINAGTKISEIKAMFGDGKTVRVIRPDGRLASGVIATGYKIELYIHDDLTDSLTAVVNGDTDGDGFVSAYDLYAHERILRGANANTCYYAAADVNRNGVVADNDFRALRNAVLQRGNVTLGTPDDNLYGVCSAQTLSHIEKGDIIEVAVFISGCKYARGANGTVNYSKGLEFISAESEGWNIGYDAKEQSVEFYTYGNDGNVCGKAYKILVNLKFRVTADAGEEISFSSDNVTVAFSDGCRKMKFETKKVTVASPQYGDFEIKISNAYSFKFTPHDFEYSVVIPYNSAMPDITIIRNEKQTYQISDMVIPDSGVGSVVIRIDEEDGESRYYTINARRDKEPEFDTNCRLGALEIEGFRLTPLFSPDVYDYTVLVPFGTEKINLYCVAQNETAQVFISDTTLYETENVVTITVVAPDGETLVYTINVRVLPQGQRIDDNDSGSKKAAVISVTLFMVLSIALIPFFLKKVRK